MKMEAREWYNTINQGERQIQRKKNLEMIDQVISELSEIKNTSKDNTQKITALEKIAKLSKMHYDMMNSDTF